MGEASGVRQVGPLTGLMVGLITRMVPETSRDRYDVEFRAELVTLSAWRRPAEVLSLLAGAPRLRRILQDTSNTALEKAGKDWRCHLGRHHWVRVQDDNPENLAASHLECVRCLKIREVPDSFQGGAAAFLTGPGGGEGFGGGGA
jgi:hypothetical protein